MRTIAELITIGCTAAALVTLSGCGSLAKSGTTWDSMDGIITGLEKVDIDVERIDSSTGTVLGAIGGAILGQVIGRSTSGTLSGAALGGLAGALGSTVANRGTGLRITIDTPSGTLYTDYVFSCALKKGTRVRMLTGNNTTQLQVLQNGRFTTAQRSSTSDCQSFYDAVVAGQYAADPNAVSPYSSPDFYNYDAGSTGTQDYGSGSSDYSM